MVDVSFPAGSLLPASLILTTSSTPPQARRASAPCGGSLRRSVALTGTMAKIFTQSIDSGRLTIGIRTAGRVDRPGLVLLHGWPQCASAFDSVLEILGEEFFAVAPDLPGVGSSHGLPQSGEKTAIVPHVWRVIEATGARDAILVGHDVGGMVAFACFRAFGERLAGGAILNTVVPGIDPWDKVLADPRIWHFAFHAIPDLPEALVGGQERRYFDYFFDVLAGPPRRIGDAARETYTAAYKRAEALKAGFDWYRGMADDAKANARGGPLPMPLLCVRGDHDPNDIEAYLAGFHTAGVTDAVSKIIPGGHFSADEAPEALAEALREFGKTCRS
jgi:pimeloyl-ACP methyl ester carboxylesterase